MKEAGVGAVKLEGGAHMQETIEFLTQNGIPVLAHIGLTPQSYHQMGGYRVQGKSEADFERVLKDAKAVEQAGPFLLS